MASGVVWATVAAGTVATLLAVVATALTGQWLVLLPFVIIVVIAEFQTVQLTETGREKHTFSFTIAAVMASVIMLPTASPLVGLASGVVFVLALGVRQLDKVLFNLTNRQVSAAVASAVYVLLRPPESEFGFWHLVAASAAVAAFYMANTGTVSLIIALHSGQRLVDVMRRSAWSAPTQFFLGLTGAFVGGAHQQLGAFASTMFVVPIVLMRITLALYADRSRKAILELQGLNTQLADENRQRTAAEESLAESEEHLRSVLDNVGEGIMTVDQRGIVQSVNAAAEQVFGYAATEVLGQHCGMLISSLGRYGMGTGFSQYLDGGRLVGFGAYESQGLRKDGSSFPIEITLSEMRRATDRMFIISARDITERKRAEEALEHQALYDQLTNLPNRTLLHDRLRQAILTGSREAQPLALLVMDLDRFKEVNDTFGHQYGDLLLEQIGPRLRAVLRVSDTVARLGGDEFAILLPDADRAEAEAVATRLLETLDPPFAVEGHNLTVGASIGLALSPEHGEDAQTLLRRADVAMYVAKREGDGYAIYSAEQDRHSPSRLTLVGDLRHAIETEGLMLHYQPTLDLQTGEFAGAEALIRWHHPERGFLAPDEFIPVAEQTGLIRNLSQWVLESALRQSRAWQQMGLNVPVAINLSMRDLHDPQVPDSVARLLSHWRVAPESLTLEITESTLMADPARALEVVARLSAMGIMIAIDDFGTGYSSLAYLKRLPVDKLKIDKSFVRNLATDAHDASIVQSTVGLAHALGLRLVAEGIEDQASWELLAGMGCDVGQGYFISRPIPADKLTEWLQGRSPSGEFVRAA